MVKHSSSHVISLLQSILLEYSGGMERPLTDKEALKRFLINLLEGYEKENHIDNAWTKRIDIFVFYRRLMLFVILKGLLESNKILYNSFKVQISEGPQYVLECIG